jgi:hypothetical protein
VVIEESILGIDNIDNSDSITAMRRKPQILQMVLVLKSLSEKVSKSFVLRFPAVQVSLCFRSVLATRHHDITVSLVAAKTSRRGWTTWAG